VSNEQSYLIIISGPRKDEKIQLSEAPITIGRSDQADQTIGSINLSRQPCPVFYRWAQVTSSRTSEAPTATYVNEKRISTATLLANGDRIRLGTDVILQMVVPEIPRDATVVTSQPVIEAETVEQELPVTQLW